MLVVIGAVGLLWIVIPLLAAAMVFWLYALRKGRSCQPAFMLFRLAAAAVLFFLLAMPLNQWVFDQEVKAAKACVEEMVPLLEDYRRQHGAWPTSLEQLPTLPPLPWLLRDPHCYRSEGDGYTFSFSQPGGLIDVWVYESKTQAWNLST